MLLRRYRGIPRERNLASLVQRSFAIYYEDGRPAPPSALDSAKERGENFVAFGTLVAPLTDDARMKLISLDSRLKGRIPPCLPKSLNGGAPEPLPWISVAVTAPAGAKAVAAGRGKGAASSAKKAKPRGKGAITSPSATGGDGTSEWGGLGEGGVMWGEGPGEGMLGEQQQRQRERQQQQQHPQQPDGKRARKSNVRYDDSPVKYHRQKGDSTGRAGQGHYRSPPGHKPTGELVSPGGEEAVRSESIVGTPPVQSMGNPNGPASKGATSPGGTITSAFAASSSTAAGSKKRKASNGGAAEASGSACKKAKPPPSFSLAAFSGGLDGSETRGVPSAEFVGSCFRRGRKDGLLLYYVEKAPRDHPFEYESKAAGAASLDWSLMRKHLKVDAFCMETFRWYGAKVAEVSQERQQVKVSKAGCT